MSSHHYLMLILVAVAFYFVGRYFPQPSNALGLK